MSSSSSFSVPQGPSPWPLYLVHGEGGGHFFEDTCASNNTTSYHNWQKGTSLLTTTKESEDSHDGGLLPGGGGGQVIGGSRRDEVDFWCWVIVWTFLTFSIGYLVMFFTAVTLDRLNRLPKKDDTSFSTKVRGDRRSSTPVVPGSAVVKYTKDKFEVKMDVTQFSPEEVTVTEVDKYLVVEGKHEEKEDEHGMNMSRSFTHRYKLHEDLNAENFYERVTCTWSTDGVLLITVPRKEAIIEKGAAKVFPIKQTGMPAGVA